RSGFEKEDALQQGIGMLGLLLHLVVEALIEPVKPPILIHPRMQKILVARGQFATQQILEVIDDFSRALHDGAPGKSVSTASFAPGPAPGKLARGASQGYQPTVHCIQGGGGGSSRGASSALRKASRRSCSARAALISRITASTSAACSGSSKWPLSRLSGV